ncbi:ribokinase [soil metagenome]
MTKIDIVVVGSLNMDLVASVPRLPATGETLIGSGFATHHGGKGGNQAVAAARLGARVAMIGRVGNDDHGRRLRAALADEGIDVTGVSIDPDTPTGIALITVDSASRNTIVVVPGSNLRLTIDELDRHAWTGSRCLICQLEIDDAVTAAALRRAHAAGLRTYLNPAPAPLDASRWIETLAFVSTLVVNETEAALLSGLPVGDVGQAKSAARSLRSHGCDEVVVTLGSAGVVRSTAAGEVHHAGFVVEAVDSTAAGDTFIGALAAAFVAGRDGVSSIEFAQRAAALSVTRHGAQSSIPTVAEVTAWTA